MEKEDKQLNILISVFIGVVVFAVLIIGYIAIFDHPDYMTRQQTRELVDSILIEIYD